MKKQNSSHFRWLIVALLFFITVANYIDRSSISYAIEDISKLFHLNDDQEGIVLGAFGIGYLITTLIGGIAADRYGPRITLSIAVICWAISMITTGLSTGFIFIFLTRVLLGLAEGPNFPTMTRAIGDWLPKHERAAALSYSLIAVPVALAIGGPIVSQLIIHTSWRGMFFILGGVALIWLPFWWFLFRDFPKQSQQVSQAELQYIHKDDSCPVVDPEQQQINRKKVKGLWRYLLTNPTLLVNYWAFFVFGYFLFFFMNWLPSYLGERYHLQLVKIGLFTILPWAFAAVLMWAVGHLSDFIYKKTHNYRLARSYPIWISQLLAAICVVPIIFVIHLDLAIFFISLAVGFSMSANGAYYAANIDLAKARAGTALGIMDAMFAVSGFLSPAITGWVISLTGHFTMAYVLLALLALSSVILVIVFHHPESAKKLHDV